MRGIELNIITVILVSYSDNEINQNISENSVQIYS